MKWWKAAATYAFLITIIYMNRNVLSDWLLHGDAPLPLVAISALILALFPVLPYKLVIGALGFKYGPLTGAMVSWTAVSLASAIVFLFVSRFYRDAGRAYISRFRHAEQLGQLMERRPFLTIFTARLIPFLPQALVNIYPALLSIRLSTYIVASSLGKLPALLFFSYLGSQLAENWRQALLILILYVLMCVTGYAVYRIWRSRS